MPAPNDAKKDTGWIKTAHGRWWHFMQDGKLLCTKHSPKSIRLFDVNPPLRQNVCLACRRKVEAGELDREVFDASTQA